MTRGKSERRKLSILLTVVFFAVFCFGLNAEGTQETQESAEQQATALPVETDIVVAALKGPSGFAAAKMIKDDFQPGFNVNAEYIIVSSPMEAVSKMTSGEIDAAFLPVNTAAKLYTKGVEFRLAAVSGLGSLYMLSTDKNIRDWTDLKGKKIYLTGKGATPDYVIRYLLISNGLDPRTDVTLDFTAGPPQIAQLLIAGKADTAFIPQPFALQAKLKSDADIVLDPQQELMDLRGSDRAFPFTAFVISERLIDASPDAAAALSSALGESIEWVLANPEPASSVIDELGIMGAAVAKMSIHVSGIEYIPAAEAEAGVNDFLTMLLELDPVSVGGTLPDEGFYFKN